MEREDGEMSDDNSMIIDDMDVDDPFQATHDDCTMVFKAEKNGLVVQKLEKVDAAKLDERAKRFGLNLTGTHTITQKQIDELYENCGIQSGNERHIRFDTIHLNGVDGLTTKEIFQYLEDYKPLSLEWIDDTSCNVVCQDHISAALALLAHSHEIKDGNLSAVISDKNHHWRQGVHHPKNEMILIRYATNSDKKLTNKRQGRQVKNRIDSALKNPWGDLCKSWGVYDHQEVFQYQQSRNEKADNSDEEDNYVNRPVKSSRLASRLGKRVCETKSSVDSEYDNSDSEWKAKSKVPRMRMHADDEEKKQEKSRRLIKCRLESINEFSPLSIQVANSKGNYIKREASKLSDKFKYHTSEPKSSVQLRLGERLEYSNDSNSSDEVSGNFGYNFRSQVQKINDQTKSASSVWSRLDTNNSPQKHSDLRKFITSKKKNDDLRDRIGKLKKENLRIEIDNSS